MTSTRRRPDAPSCPGMGYFCSVVRGHMAISRLACILAIVAVANAYAGCVEKSPIPACVVTVTQDAVSARFPPLENPADSWQWQRKSTNEGYAEYAWAIRFGTCSDPGNTLRQDYSHSLAVHIFKFPGSTERAGTFAELMLAAQGDVWRCDSAGSNCTRDQGIRFTGVREPRYTEISIARDPGVDALIVSRPPGAVLSSRTPDKAWYCHAIVEYK